MRDLEERGVEYPPAPLTADDTRETSERVTLRHPERFDSVMNAPVPAVSHIEDNRVNYARPTSFTSQQTRLFEDPEIKDAMGTGWVLSLQQYLGLRVADGGVGEEMMHLEDRIQSTGCWQSPEDESYHGVVTIRTFCVPDVEDGTSLLITHPHFLDTDEYTVLPTLIDADRVSMYIDIPVMIHYQGSHFLENNTPIAQIIPVPRSIVRAKAEFEEPVRTQ